MACETTRITSSFCTHNHAACIDKTFAAKANISLFLSLSRSFGIAIVAVPLSKRGRHGCSARSDLPQNHPLGPLRRRATRPRTKLSPYHIRPEPSSRDTTLRGRPRRKYCPMGNTVQSLQPCRAFCARRKLIKKTLIDN